MTDWRKKIITCTPKNNCPHCSTRVKTYLNSVKEFQDEISRLRGALQQYADGKGLEIKPEKKHLYAEDMKMSSPEWLQRSMSDYDITLIAKQALAPRER